MWPASPLGPVFGSMSARSNPAWLLMDDMTHVENTAFCRKYRCAHRYAWLVVPAETVIRMQGNKAAAAREAALAAEATIEGLKLQLARAGLALKDSEDRQVCLRSGHPVLPGTRFRLSGAAQSSDTRSY